MNTKRILYLSVLLVIFIFTGCARHMADVSIPDKSLDQFSKKFAPSSVYIIPLHEIAYDSEAMYGLNYYIALMKKDAKPTDNVKRSADLISTQILRINSEDCLVLFDYGNELDTTRRILEQSRVVPGMQFPVEGGIEKVCGRGIQAFNWELYKTMDEYIADGIIKVVNIEAEGDEGHVYANKLIADIFVKYSKLDVDGAFEKFLRGLGTFSSNEIHVMIASSFNPTQFYPAVGVKLFSIIRALSGSADLNDIYYYTAKSRKIDTAFMLYNNVQRMQIKIQNELYQENRLQNQNLLGIEIQKLEAWKANELEKIEDWRLLSFAALDIDPNDKDLDEIDREAVASINEKAEKYVLRIEARFETRIAYYKELYK